MAYQRQEATGSKGGSTSRDGSTSGAPTTICKRGVADRDGRDQGRRRMSYGRGVEARRENASQRLTMRCWFTTHEERGSSGSQRWGRGWLLRSSLAQQIY